MISSDYISKSIFPKKIQKPISFIEIKKENRTKRTVYKQFERKNVDEPTCAYIPKQISELKRKYKDILNQNSNQPKKQITKVTVSIPEKSEDIEDCESFETFTTIKGSQLYSPVFSPLFPSPDGEKLEKILKEAEEDDVDSDFCVSASDAFVMLRRNLSSLQTETHIPTHILPTISRGVTACLTLRDQRYVISSTEEWEIFNKLRRSNDYDSVILKNYDVDITVAKFNCLREGMWLNDEIINFYMKMLQAYDDRKVVVLVNHRRSYFFNSFLITRLLDTYGEYRFDQVCRWTKKFSHILDYDKIFFPININNTHWTLAVIYIQRQEVIYYCSMHGNGEKYLVGLKKWLQDTYLQFGVENEDWSLWSFTEDRSCPRQTDGFNCGVFVCMFCDFLSDNLSLNFTSSDVKVYFRSKLGIDILRGELSYFN